MTNRGFRFRDRSEAGRVLARELDRYAGRDDVVVLALPRGGVPVAHEVAKALGAPLDVFVVRKLGVPGHREFAMGAVASGGSLVLDERLIRSLGIGREEIQQTIADINVRSHTMRFIVPEEAELLKMPNPCTGCHTDKPVSWATAALKSWTH